MLVKKYGNRRLYDTEASRYITLEDLAARVEKGEDVEVVDAKTGQDLTQATLAQIILESRGAARLLPVPLLKQLIRMGDDSLAEFCGRYMTWAMEVYLQIRQGAQAITPWNPLSLFAQSPLARLLAGSLPWAEPPPMPAQPRSSSTGTSSAAEGAPPAPVEEEIASLRRDIEQIKRAMGRKRRA